MLPGLCNVIKLRGMLGSQVGGEQFTGFPRILPTSLVALSGYTARIMCSVACKDIPRRRIVLFAQIFILKGNHARLL